MTGVDKKQGATQHPANAPRKIRIATRTSQLALVQTQQVIAALQNQVPFIEVELVKIVTTGDRIQHQSLAALGGKGLFVQGLEEALAQGHADIAMHSLKDVPPALDTGFCLAAVLARQSPHDVFVSDNYATLADLPAGAIVGTSSVRRKAALLNLRSDITVKMIRGNVDTRLKKLAGEDYDALILAEAGLARLGLEARIKEVLPIALFPPSVGQGVIAIECLSKRSDLLEILQNINHQETYLRITAERAMNHALRASCTSPVGSFATLTAGQLQLSGVVWSADGKTVLKTLQNGHPQEAAYIGQRAAEDLLRQGARQWLDG